MQTLQQVFGERGGGFGALMNLTQFIDQLPTVAAKMKSWQGGDKGIFELLQASPIQQGRQAWADLDNVLLDIGQVVLPPLVAMLHTFDEQLKLLDKHWPKSGSMFGVPKSGTLGAALGKGMGEGVLWGAGAGALVGAVGGPASPVTVPAGTMLGGAIGAVGGGIYEGGRWLFGLGDKASDTKSGGFKTIPIPGAAGSSIGPGTGSFHFPDDDAIPRNARPRMYSPASYTGNGAGLLHFASFSPATGFGGFSGGGGAIRIPNGVPPSGIVGHVHRSQEVGARRLMRDLMARGWSKEAAAVAAGNASVESGFDTSNNTGDGGTSWGLMQWHLDRRRNMVAYAKSHGKNWNDWDSQVGFLDHEWRQRFGNDSVGSHDLNRLKYMGKKYEGYSTNSFGTRNALTDRFLRLPTDVGQSSVVHPPKDGDKEIHLHHTSTLDGRVVAKSTMKQIVRMGNGPTRGPRLPDYTATTPITV